MKQLHDVAARRVSLATAILAATHFGPGISIVRAAELDPTAYHCPQMLRDAPPKWRTVRESLRSDQWRAMLADLSACVCLYGTDVRAVRDAAATALTHSGIPGTTRPATLQNPAGRTLAHADTTTLELQALQLRQSAAFLKKWIGAVTKVPFPASSTVGDGRAAKGASGKQGDAPTVDSCADQETERVDVEDVRRALEGTRDLLEEAMDVLGLRQWLSAEVVPGLVYGNAADASTTSQLTYVRIQSRHVGITYDEDRNLDFSIGGAFGLQPTLTLVQTRLLTTVGSSPSRVGTDTIQPQPPAPHFKQAFVWEVRPQAQLHFAREQAQLSLFGRAGQALLFDTDELRNGSLGRELVSLVGDGSRASWFFGGGVGLTLLGNGRSVLHEQKDADVPLDLSFTYTYDLRFRPDATAAVVFDRPEQRLGVRLSLNLPLQRAKLSDPARSFKPSTTSLGLTIEHEFAIYGNGVPSSTKISLRGDTNLFKLLK